MLQVEPTFTAVWNGKANATTTSGFYLGPLTEAVIDETVFLMNYFNVIY